MEINNEQEKLWLAYHEDKKNRRNLKEDVRKAWDRTDKEGRIDPYMSSLPVVCDAEKKRLREECKKLFVYTQATSTPHVVRAGQKDRDYCALLFSPDGILLHIYGNSRIQKWMNDRGIHNWTDWNEKSIGPSIYSIGMSRGKNTMISGEECYIQSFLGVEWDFNPIILDEGGLIGALILMSYSGDFNDAKENLAISLSKNIEIQYFWFDALTKCMDATEGMGAMVFDLSEGQHRVEVMSNQVFTMLKIPIREYFYKKAEEFIDPLPRNKEFWNILDERKIVNDYTIQISCRGRRSTVCISTSPFKLSGFHIDGTILVFNSYQRIQKLASRVASGEAKYTFDTIVGQSSSFIQTLMNCKNVASNDANVLILGETGSGKDVLAQAIHNASSRSDGPFIAMNCAAFSKDLITSELFGYEDGAFTGAKKGGVTGKIELANHGTLFLDEIGDMPMELQAVLLRVLETRQFRKVGGNKLISVDVRVIAATNQNLKEKISQKEFRSDLYYRLGVFRVKVPPLRDRKEDILMLADYFIGNLCARYAKRRVSFSESAEKLLLGYSWPGNVRELQNTMERVVSIFQGSVIDADMIAESLDDDFSLYGDTTQDITEKSIMNSEKQEMINALKECRGNRSEASKKIQMSRSTFYRRMKEYGIQINSRGEIV